MTAATRALTLAAVAVSSFATLGLGGSAHAADCRQFLPPEVCSPDVGVPTQCRIEPDFSIYCW